MAPLLQKADLIFGMGMLDMGITFSFRQLILDCAIVSDVKGLNGNFPENIKDPAYVKELVAQYRGESPVVRPKNSRFFFKGDPSEKDLNKKADELANEIIHTHEGPYIDRAILNQIRRIVLSAE